MFLMVRADLEKNTQPFFFHEKFLSAIRNWTKRESDLPQQDSALQPSSNLVQSNRSAVHCTVPCEKFQKDFIQKAHAIVHFGSFW